jgi:hypothetical protein
METRKFKARADKTPSAILRVDFIATSKSKIKRFAGKVRKTPSALSP